MSPLSISFGTRTARALCFLVRGKPLSLLSAPKQLSLIPSLSIDLLQLSSTEPYNRHLTSSITKQTVGATPRLCLINIHPLPRPDAISEDIKLMTIAPTNRRAPLPLTMRIAFRPLPSRSSSPLVCSANKARGNNNARRWGSPDPAFWACRGILCLESSD